jgi:N-acetylmuramoyl-L-alanine amidase
VTIGRVGLLLTFVAVASVVAASCARRPPDVSPSPIAPSLLRPHAELLASRARSTSVPVESNILAPVVRSTVVAVPSPPVESTETAVATVTPVSATSMAPILVYLDPGHGGVDGGTMSTLATGTTIYEKNVALALALRAAARLRADGIGVVLSRTDDSLVGAIAADYTSDGTLLTPPGVLADLQRRIDRANASGARVFLSLHLNAYGDPSVGGTQTFFDGARPFANQSRLLATLIQGSVIAALRSQGYSTPDRGIADDQDLLSASLGVLPGDYNHLILLGPGIPGVLQPTAMPGALIEVMYLSNPPEATAIAQPATQDLVASAVAAAIEQFLSNNPPVLPTAS